MKEVQHPQNDVLCRLKAVVTYDAL